MTNRSRAECSKYDDLIEIMHQNQKRFNRRRHYYPRMYSHLAWYILFYFSSFSSFGTDELMLFSDWLLVDVLLRIFCLLCLESCVWVCFAIPFLPFSGFIFERNGGSVGSKVPRRVCVTFYDMCENSTRKPTFNKISKIKIA